MKFFVAEVKEIIPSRPWSSWISEDTWILSDSTTRPMSMLAKKITKWLKPPLEHWRTFPRQPHRIEVWWQFSHKPTPILSNSSRTTPISCGKSKLYSKRNELKSVANVASILHPTIIAGRMDTNLITLTRVSSVSSRRQITKRRQLKRITWAVVRPTRNDIQGRQL
jgi:hypothetical protein